MTRLARRIALASCFVALVASCATAPPSSTPANMRVEPAFDAAGRLSARRGNDGIAIHFTWRHAPDSDDFDVATPLGQTVARMRRDATGVRIERPGEPPAAYPDWNTLTRAVLGVALPVDGLASWIQGGAEAGSAADVERDAAGRPLVLRQQAWEIVFAYAGDDAPARPSRLVMRYPDSEPIEVRVVVDRFAVP